MIKGWARKEDLKEQLVWVWINKESPQHMPKSWKMIPVAVLEMGEVEEIKKLADSILCLAGEGPDVESHLKLFTAISREACKIMAILEGKE